MTSYSNDHHAPSAVATRVDNHQHQDHYYNQGNSHYQQDAPLVYADLQEEENEEVEHQEKEKDDARIVEYNNGNNNIHGSSSPNYIDDRHYFHNQHVAGTVTTPTPETTSKHKVKPERLDPRFAQMKNERKRDTVAAGVAGGLVGLVFFGPVGLIAGSFVSAKATKAMGKRRERKYLSRNEENATMVRRSETTGVM